LFSIFDLQIVADPSPRSTVRSAHTSSTSAPLQTYWPTCRLTGRHCSVIF